MNYIKRFLLLKTPSPFDAHGRKSRTRRLTPISVALVTIVFVATVLSVPSFQRFHQAKTGAGATSTLADTKSGNPGNDAVLSRILQPQKQDYMKALLPAMFLPVPQAGPAEPSITFLDEQCATGKTIFNPGDIVCAKVDGIDPALYTVHLDWNSTQGAVLARSTNLTATGQTRKFTLSTNAPVGKWQAVLVNQGALAIATADFTVSDPENRRVDLSVNNRAQDKVEAGNDITYKVVVFNNGPDAADNVLLTEPIPANTTFVTSSQLSGPVFTCTGTATETTCTISSMPANSYSILSTTYKVDNAVQQGTTITASVNVTNTVTEQNADDNSASADTVTAASPCVVSCGDNIVVQADSGQAGAVVTYTAPTSTGSCGAPISCSQASGSFFPVGTTPVTCVADTGDACSFTVTVENPGALSISLNGDNPMTAECGSGTNGGSGFDDPGASAVNGSGQSVSVAVTGNVDLSTPGAYTVTYTATEGNNSTSTTRTVNVVDTTKPSIEIQGANPYKIQTGSCLAFADPGASANDGCAGPVAVTSSTSGPNGLTHVDNTVPGTYTITYSATDGTHPATADRTVLVGTFDPDEVDQPSATGPPTILLNGDAQMSVECGTTFNDPGATATSCGASVNYTTSGAVDSHTPGVYTITYSATTGGGTTETHRTVTVVDTTKPVITLSGDNPMQVECHSSFTDPGASANDGCAGSLPVTASGSVDPNTPGTYVITYSAPSDPSGNSTDSVTRTVVVSDTLAPVITINGNNPATVECHTSYTDAGASADDACSGSASVTTSGSVDVNTPGSYTITYSATDGAHSASATRTVNVVDTTKPIITRSGPATVTVECHTSYTDAGATASDSCDSSVPVSTSGSVNVNVPGTYTLTYTASDDSGNAADSVTRTVTVVDTTPPVITLNGAQPSVWPANHRYKTFSVTDFVTAVSDSCDTGLGVGSVVISQVTSDETENGNGDGNTFNDIVIAADCKSVQVRAERQGGGNGRVYTITFRLTDASGRSTTATARVVVPHNPGETPVDSGVNYTVNGSCP